MKKTCTKCGESKSLSEFYPKRKGSTKLRPTCKACISKAASRFKADHPEKVRAWKVDKGKKRTAQAKYRAKNKEKLLEKQREYRAANSDMVKKKRAAYYRKNLEKVKSQVAKWQEENKERFLYLVNVYRKVNKVRLRAAVIRWNKRNPGKRRAYLQNRRARIRGIPGFFTVEDSKRLFQEQDGLCYYCSTELWKTGFEHDHKNPVSRPETNPTNWPENIVLACPSCNHRKNDRTAEEFFNILAKDALHLKKE